MEEDRELDVIHLDKLKDEETSDPNRKKDTKKKKKKKASKKDSNASESEGYSTDDLTEGYSTDDLTEGETDLDKKEERRKRKGSKQKKRRSSKSRGEEEEGQGENDDHTKPPLMKQKTEDLIIDMLENETLEMSKIKDADKKEEEEKDKKAKEKPKKVSYFKLFRYADWIDIILMLIGSICAMGHGVLMPMFAIIFGNVINAFASPSGLQNLVNTAVIDFLILAAVAAVSSFLQVFCLMNAGQRQANKIRKAYFKFVFSFFFFFFFFFFLVVVIVA